MHSWWKTQDFSKIESGPNYKTAAHAFVKATSRLGLQAPFVARNEYCHEPDVVLNTFCVTRFCQTEMFQFLKENVLSLTSSLAAWSQLISNKFPFECKGVPTPPPFSDLFLMSC